MTDAKFEIDVTQSDAAAFATLSGDYNPLHTNVEYARQTKHGRPILHGAYSAGLISRLAGMYLPGDSCLLHSLKLKFVAPIIPPQKLQVTGKLVSESSGVGRVEAKVTDRTNGRLYVDAVYEFSHHTKSKPVEIPTRRKSQKSQMPREDSILVTGATGDLGQSLVKLFGPKAIGTSRSSHPDFFQINDMADIGPEIGEQKLEAIVHCAFPAPDTERLTNLSDTTVSVEHYIGDPVKQIIALAQLLKRQGAKDAALILIGSTASEPGRHNYKTPLYSISKSLLPTISRILAVELGLSGQRCINLVFDVIDGGMNGGMSDATRIGHSDRSPSGSIITPKEAATQIQWLLTNRSSFVSGATIHLSGGALP